MLELRPYQVKLVEQTLNAISKNLTKPLVFSSMRSGKTVIYAALIGRLKPNRSLIVVPWADLKYQVIDKLKSCGITQTRVETIQKLLMEPECQVDLMILDECSHYCNRDGMWQHIFEKVDSPIVIGGSGTPFRLDKEPLMIQNGGPFNILIEGPSQTDLTSQGYLANLIYRTPEVIQRVEKLPIYFRSEIIAYIESVTSESPDITDQVVDKYLAEYKGQSAIIFCKSVHQAEEVAKSFRDQNVEAKALHYYIAKRDRATTLTNFKEGKLTIVTTCNLLSEGYDNPACKLGILLRRTNSLSLFLQQISRPRTPYYNKDAVILDLVGNIYKHGTPDAIKIREHII